MKHPIEKYNQQQAETLASLPEDQREFWARQFRLGNATYCYHAQFKEDSTADLNLADEVLSVYFEEWLAGLPAESIQTIFRAEGLAKAKRTFPFRRYVLERNDLGMDDFLKKNLSQDDYQYHLGLGKTIDS